MLPPLHEGSEGRKLDRFDLLSQCSQRASTTDLHDPSRAPLDVLDLAPELSSHQLASSFPLGQPRFDPVAWPAVAPVNLERCYWPRLSDESGENLSPVHRCVHCRLE